MRVFIKNGLFFYFILFLSCQDSPEKTSPSRFDISSKKVAQQAEKFIWDSLSKAVYHLSVNPQWFADSTGFAYQTNTSEGQQYYTVTFSTQKRKKAFDTKRLAQEIKKITEDSVSAQNLPLENVNWLTRSKFTFFLKNEKYKVDIADYTISKTGKNKVNKTKSVSPDGTQVVFIKAGNLYLKNIKTGNSYPLSSGGSRSYVYGSAYGWSQTMKGENAKPEPRLQVKWAPDSRKLLTQITDIRAAKKMYMLDWSIDSLYRPQLLSYYRPSPGDTAFVKLIPVIFDTETRAMTKIDLAATPQLVDLGMNLQWTADSRYLVGTYDRRGFKKKDIIEVDPETGEVSVLYTDTSRTNIDYHAKFRFVESQDKAFITTEKSGWKQIYQIDWETGRIQPVTQGEYVVKDIKAIDTLHKQLYFTASGKEKGSNPYFNKLYTIGYDGSEIQLLTPESGNHDVIIAPDHRYFIDNTSSANRPTVSYLRDIKDGERLMKVDSADVDKLKKKGWEPPQLFTTLAHDDETTLYGALWKPTDFDSRKKYPIVDYTYTGPHTNVYPNTFSKGIYGLYDSPQALAELGFVVMQVDGLGSNGRSKAFHDWSYRNLGDNLKDHTLAIRHLGEKYHWIDTTRVGIYGHSFGGYDAAHALLAFHDIYDVAIAESGDHDWRMEKAWYPELYAGWPVDSVYDKQSNITMATELKGKLLLIHGGIDENVNPSATLKLSEALIKADKYFDLLIIPSARHHFSKAYSAYVQKKRWHYFVNNLYSLSTE